MRRARYIRIFVSSTFVDTKIERNILRKLETQLNAYANRKGWSFEMIDLRWGVSKENTIKQQTVRVCLNEIDQCMRLSPKPSFLFMLGNRYGWVPLPWVLENDIMPLIRQFATKREQLLLDEWYRLDSNVIQADGTVGRYELKPREGRYIDDKIYDKEVYTPLLNAIKRVVNIASSEELRMKYCASATEMEINHAILKHSDTEHVIGYFRDLLSVPTEQDKDFDDREWQRMDDLKNEVKQRLPKGRYLEKKLFYNDYVSQSYHDFFYGRMGRMLKDLVDEVIAENEMSELDYEITQHENLLESVNRQPFVGRQKLIQDIVNWCTSETKTGRMSGRIAWKMYYDSLWISGVRGSGKTALVCQIAKLLRKRGVKVSYRNVGLTRMSLDAESRLHSMEAELGLPKDNYNGAPVVIIMDGIRKYQVREPNLNIKYIFTSTDPLGEIKEQQHMPTEIKLPLMENHELCTIIQAVIESKGRMDNLFFPSNIAGIQEQYRLPANMCDLAELTAQPSWIADKILNVPCSVSGIMRERFRILIEQEGFDRELVHFVLMLFYFERQGFSSKEINHILAADSKIYKDFVEDGHHEWIDNTDMKELPTAIWLRLSNHIGHYISLNPAESGMLYSYNRKQFGDIAFDMVSKENSGIIPRVLNAMCCYYGKKSASGDPHALREYIYTLGQLYTHAEAGSRAKVFKTMVEQLCSWRFVCGFSKLYSPRELSGDVREFRHNGMLSDGQSEILERIEKEISPIVNPYTDDEFISAILNSPWKGYVHNSLLMDLKDQDRYFRNSLAQHMNVEHETYHVVLKGKGVALSDDGKWLLEKDTDARQVNIIDIYSGKRERELCCNANVREVVCTPDMTKLCLLLDSGKVVLYDTTTKKVTWQGNAPKGASWVTVSDDGRVFACGGGESLMIVSGNDGAILDISNCNSGRLSASGQHLWACSSEDNKVYCVQKNDYVYQRTTLKQMLYREQEALTVKQVLACDDKCVVLSTDEYKTVIYTMGYGYAIFDGQSDIAAINRLTGKIKLLDWLVEVIYDYDFLKPNKAYCREHRYSYEVISANGKYGYDEDMHLVGNLDELTADLPIMRYGGNVSCSDDGSVLTFTMRASNSMEWMQALLFRKDGYAIHYLPMFLEQGRTIEIKVSHDGSHLAVLIDSLRVLLYKISSADIDNWQLKPVATLGSVDYNKWHQQVMRKWPELFGNRPFTTVMYEPDMTYNGQYFTYLPWYGTEIIVELPYANYKIPTGESLGFKDCLVVIPAKRGKNVYVVNRNHYGRDRQSIVISLVDPTTKSVLKMYNCQGMPRGFCPTNEGLVFITQGFGIDYIKGV